MRPEFIPDVSGVDCKPTGSRVICNPAPTDTDEDWLVFVPPHRQHKLTSALKEQGWKADIDGEYVGVPNFISWRKGNYNLIVTSWRRFFDRSVLATELATRFNLLNKQDRCDLFAAIRGDWA